MPQVRCREQLSLAVGQLEASDDSFVTAPWYRALGMNVWQRVATHATPSSGYATTSGNRLVEMPRIRTGSLVGFERSRMTETTGLPGCPLQAVSLDRCRFGNAFRRRSRAGLR